MISFPYFGRPELAVALRIITADSMAEDSVDEVK
jgi:hypothetical protein